MVTREGIVIILMTVFFFIIASNILVGWLYILISILISMLLINMIYPHIALRGIEITRTRVGKCHEDDYSQVKLKIKNTGKYTKHLFKVEDVFPLKENGKNNCSIFINTIKPGEEKEFSYKEKATRRGLHSFPYTSLISRAPLGIFQARKKINPGGINKIIIFPKVYKIKNIFLKGQGNINNSAEAYSNKSGQSGSFLGIREYSPGDSKKFIHWRSTAKRNRLMLKEFEEISSPPVAIFIDCNKELIRGKEKETTLEYSLRFAATLSIYLNKKNIPLKLIAFDGEEKIFSSKSIDENLLWLSKIKGEGKDSINKNLKKLSRITTGRTNLIIFTSDTELNEKHLRNFYKRGNLQILYFDGSSFSMDEKGEGKKEVLQKDRGKIYYRRGDNPESIIEKLIKKNL